MNMVIGSRQHVAAGEYFVGHRQKKVLQAFLGTCVGVAIYDKNADVGGLIHLLLPEPITQQTSFLPERYASTGIPIFINALVEAGASPHSMQATVAGGALVGPVSEQDLELNIGGRTAEVAETILNNAGISVETSETGGFFTCSLNLKMDDWTCRIEPAGQDKIDVQESADVPSLDEIHQAMDRIQPIPQVALKVLRIINEEKYDIEKISREVQQDQVISAQTLKLCNSAMFARKKRIESLDHALVFLGQDQLVKFILTAALKNYFGQVGKGYSLCKGGIYHHAVGTAVMAEKIADLTGATTRSTAYTAGLLHDIGKVVLDQYITSAYPLFYRRMNKDEDSFTKIEKDILGTDHTLVGSELAEKWAFPESLRETVRYHHAPDEATQHPELAHIIYLADLLLSRFSSGLEIERLDTHVLDKRLQQIGLSSKNLAQVVDLIPDTILESPAE